MSAGTIPNLCLPSNQRPSFAPVYPLRSKRFALRSKPSPFYIVCSNFARRRRWFRRVYGKLIFGVVVFALSPPEWIRTWLLLLSERPRVLGQKEPPSQTNKQTCTRWCDVVADDLLSVECDKKGFAGEKMLNRSISIYIYLYIYIYIYICF